MVHMVEWVGLYSRVFCMRACLALGMRSLKQRCDCDTRVLVLVLVYIYVCVVVLEDTICIFYIYVCSEFNRCYLFFVVALAGSQRNWCASNGI